MPIESIGGKMSYVDKMLKIPYDQHDGISVNQVEVLCAEADEEIESRQHADDMNTDLILKLTDDLEAKDKDITKMQAVLTETQELLLGGSKGSSSIVDTVWSSSTPNTTLYELIHLVLTKEKQQ